MVVIAGSWPVEAPSVCIALGGNRPSVETQEVIPKRGPGGQSGHDLANQRSWRTSMATMTRPNEDRDYVGEFVAGGGQLVSLIETGTGRCMVWPTGEVPTTVS